MIADAQLAKLPKYAREEIARLRRHVADLEKQHDDMVEGQTAIAWQVLLEEPRHLPNHAKIQIAQDDGLRIEIGRAIRQGIPVVEVRSMDGNHIYIEPEAANAVRIRADLR